MNSRIKELAEQARKRPLGDSWCYTTPAEFEQKFAELIVRECAKRVDYWESRQGEHADDLLKHFGIER